MKLHRHVLFPILFAFIFSFADPAAVNDTSFSEKAVTTAAESAGKSVIPGGKSIGVMLQSLKPQTAAANHLLPQPA